jgi:hypothetical protein
MATDDIFRLRAIHVELSALVPEQKIPPGEYNLSGKNPMTQAMDANCRRRRVLDGLQKIIDESSPA